MSPDEEVQVTMTRREAMRVHAALAALCELQRMMPGLPSAAGLTDAVEEIEAVLPRLRECFPDEETIAAARLEKHATDVKSYADPFSVRIDDLPSLSSQDAAAIFATEYDPAIKMLLQTLQNYTDFTHDQFHELLDSTKALLVQTMPVPPNLTVQESRPYVETSDLITLGALAYEMYQRQDQIDDQITKPF